MNSIEMLDTLQKAFNEMDLFCDRPNPDVVTFFSRVLGRTFKGQAFSKANEFLRIELWLNLYGDTVNYESVKENIKLAKDLLKNGNKTDISQRMGYGVNEENHHFVVLADIKTDGDGNVSVEQCKEDYQQMVRYVASHLMIIFS